MNFYKGDLMKQMMLFVAATLVITVAQCASADAIPSGPSNLLPANAAGNTTLWVGGDVAKGLFDGMTAAAILKEDGREIRSGKHVGCLHDQENSEVEYSCVLDIKLSTGTAIKR